MLVQDSQIKAVLTSHKQKHARKDHAFTQTTPTKTILYYHDSISCTKHSSNGMLSLLLKVHVSASSYICNTVG